MTLFQFRGFLRDLISLRAFSRERWFGSECHSFLIQCMPWLSSQPPAEKSRERIKPKMWEKDTQGARDEYLAYLKKYWAWAVPQGKKGVVESWRWEYGTISLQTGGDSGGNHALIVSFVKGTSCKFSTRGNGPAFSPLIISTSFLCARYFLLIRKNKFPAQRKLACQGNVSSTFLLARLVFFQVFLFFGEALHYRSLHLERV